MPQISEKVILQAQKLTLLLEWSKMHHISLNRGFRVYLDLLRKDLKKKGSKVLYSTKVI